MRYLACIALGVGIAAFTMSNSMWWRPELERISLEAESAEAEMSAALATYDEDGDTGLEVICKVPENEPYPCRVYEDASGTSLGRWRDYEMRLRDGTMTATRGAGQLRTPKVMRVPVTDLYDTLPNRQP